MKKRHFLRRLPLLILCMGMLLSVFALPAMADDTPLLVSSQTVAEDYGMQIDLQLSADEKTLTLSLQMKGEGLCRTQFVALAYDAAVLSLHGAKVADAPQPMTDISTFTLEGGWRFDTVKPYAAVTGNAGYLYLYPAREDAVTYSSYTTILSFPFSVSDATALHVGSIRLITEAEENLFAQSCKATVATEDLHMTYGADANDALSGVSFVGNTPITGAREESAVGTFETWVNPFTDVKADAPYFDAIAYVCKNNLFQGSSETTFDPETSMIRATFATVLCRLAGAEEEAKADTEAQKEFLETFTDVKDTWYVPYLAWGVKTGLFLGNDRKEVMPNDNISTEQMYLLMMRFFDLYEYETAPYEKDAVASLPDGAEVHNWAADGVAFAMANGLLLTDEEGNARPRADAMRWELATVLKRMDTVRVEVEAPVGEGGAEDVYSTVVAPHWLTDRQKDLYRHLYTAIVDGYTEIDTTAYQMTMDEIYPVFAEVYKTPEMFYITGKCVYYINNVTGLAVTVCPEYELMGSARMTAMKQYKEKIAGILADVDENWTDFEKTLYLHEYLVSHYTYAEGTELHSAYELLTEYQGVCSAYTRLYTGLLRALGIQAESLYSKEMNHEWNIVNLDGSWYHIDATWDDPVPDKRGLVNHGYFLLSDAAMRAKQHSGWDAPTACTDTRYDNAWWKEMNSAFVPMDDGTWAYIDITSGDIRVWDTETDAKTTVGNIGATWYVDNAHYYTRKYSTLVRCGKVLLYNTAKEIYVYYPDTKRTESVYLHYNIGDIFGIYPDPSFYHEEENAYHIRITVSNTPNETPIEYGSLLLKNPYGNTVSGSIEGYFGTREVQVILEANGQEIASAILKGENAPFTDKADFLFEALCSDTYTLKLQADGCFDVTLGGLVLDGACKIDVTELLKPYVLLSGDCNGDNVIDRYDRELLCTASVFNKLAADSSLPQADLNADGVVDIIDLLLLTSKARFGKRASDCILQYAS